MTKFDVELLDNVLNYEQLTVLHGFLECPLNVPEHQILLLRLFVEDALKLLEIAFDCGIDQISALAHELHKSTGIILLHAFDLPPKLIMKVRSNNSADV